MKGVSIIKCKLIKKEKMKGEPIAKPKGKLQLKVKGDVSKAKNQTVEAVVIIVVCGIAITVISMIIAIVFIGVVIFGIWGGIG